jgi:hypothetical protein
MASTALRDVLDRRCSSSMSLTRSSTSEAVAMVKSIFSPSSRELRNFWKDSQRSAPRRESSISFRKSYKVSIGDHVKRWLMSKDVKLGVL